MHNTKVKDLMTQKPMFVQKNNTVRQAADMMKEMDFGFLPVGTKDNVIGIITDRDIVIRAVSTGLSMADELVERYITHQVFACNEDDYLEDAAEKMRTHKVSRLLVRDHQGHVTGILSFGGILRQGASAENVTNVVKHVTQHAVA
jgi:predicted transcriptional regulator